MANVDLEGGIKVPNHFLFFIIAMLVSVCLDAMTNALKRKKRKRKRQEVKREDKTKKREEEKKHDMSLATRMDMWAVVEEAQ